jgi:hypothetical protein
MDDKSRRVLYKTALFVKDMQKKIDAFYAETKPNLVAPHVCAEIGTVFVRIYHHTISTNSQWVVCFIMLDTGNIRMPLGMRAFDRYNVGTVLDDACLELIGDSGNVKAPDNVPSSYDPNFKKKPPTIKRELDDLDMSPEAELRRQREYGKRIRDED